MATAHENQVKTRPPVQEKNQLNLVSPEGVPLSLEIAAVGDRLTAFLLDAVFILVVVVALFILAYMAFSLELISMAIITSFVLRNFYFMFFEQRWQGSTPGKRNRKLRVVDFRGGQLSVEAIIVRNLTRDIEVFLPLTVLLAPEAIWPNAPALAVPLAAVWALILGLMPLFNKERRRVGDLIAGTVVIASPQVELLGDLADKGGPAQRLDAPVGMVFTKKQLSQYGVYELQVLEKVLRRSGFDEAPQQMETIREKICAKIDWTEDVPDDYLFLKAFYAAQRAHLEGRMLMGERREDKFDGTDPAASAED